MNARIEKDQFGFQKGKRTWDVTGELKTIRERCLKDSKKVGLCVVFVNLKKVSDRDNWKMLMEVLKKTGVQ